MSRLILMLFTMAVLSACTEINNGANRTIVAKAGDKHLYSDELPKMLNNGYSEADSISITRNFIDRWVKKELMLSRAELNLTEEYISEMNQKLEETRSNLMIYQYQQQMMVQRMDTTVDIIEIDNYYNDNIQAFNLTHALVKTVFIKIPVEAPNIDRAKKWYRSNEQEDLQNLESYCYQFADKYDDFGENWIDVSYLLRVLPSDLGNIDRFLRNNTYYEVSDSMFHYFVNIRDFRLTGAVAPMEYVSYDIKNIILNNRKIEFLQNLENGIYNEALRENQFKIY